MTFPQRTLIFIWVMHWSKTEMWQRTRLTWLLLVPETGSVGAEEVFVVITGSWGQSAMFGEKLCCGVTPRILEPQK